MVKKMAKFQTNTLENDDIRKGATIEVIKEEGESYAQFLVTKADNSYIVRTVVSTQTLRVLKPKKEEGKWN